MKVFGFLINKPAFIEDLVERLKQEKDELINELGKKERINKQLAEKIEDLNQIYDVYMETKQKVNF